MFAHNKFYLLLSIKNNIYLNIHKIFKNLSIELQDNKQIIKIVMILCFFEFASERLQDDIEIVLLAIKKSNSLEFASKILKDNKKFYY